MVGGGTDTAPAHVAFGLISLANKPRELIDETDSPRWRRADSQASTWAFSRGRKAPRRQCRGRTVEGRGRVSCAQQAGEAFQADPAAGAVAPRPWGAWQGSSSPGQCTFWKDPLALDWDPLEGLRVSSHTAWWQDQTLTARCQPAVLMEPFHGIYKAGGRWASPARLLPHHTDGGSKGQRGERALPNSRDRSPSARSTSPSLLLGPSSAGRVAV